MGSTGSTDATAPRRVFVVGVGPRADAWADVVARSPRLVLAGRCEEATTCRDEPDAAIAVVVGARSASAAVDTLRGHEGRVVVAGPLHRPVDATPHVRVAARWVAIAGVRWVQSHLRSLDAVTLSLPRSRGRAAEALAHGYALARSLLGELSVEDPWTLRGADATVRLRWSNDDALVAAFVSGDARVELRVDAGRQHLTVDGRSRTRALPTWAERALAGIVDDDHWTRLATLDEASAAARDVATAVEMLPTLALPGAAQLRVARRLRRPEAPPLRALGLRTRDLESASRRPGAPPAADAMHTELWAWRAGLKPCVFVTVEPAQAETVAAAFDAPHEIRRERRVHADPATDRWIDDRVSGQPRTELYLGRDLDAVQRLARLQADADPSRHALEIAALLGYPRCCAEAFAAQPDRADNSLNRYATAGRTEAGTGWPGALNDVFLKLNAFFACRYDCPAARVQAEAVWRQRVAEDPARADALRPWLQSPVLYFDHAHWISLHPAIDRYADVRASAGTDAGWSDLVATVARGDALTLRDDALTIRSDGATLTTIDRTDPALGVVLPFSGARYQLP